MQVSGDKYSLCCGNSINIDCIEREGSYIDIEMSCVDDVPAIKKIRYPVIEIPDSICGDMADKEFRQRIAQDTTIRHVSSDVDWLQYVHANFDSHRFSEFFRSEYVPQIGLQAYVSRCISIVDFATDQLFYSTLQENHINARCMSLDQLETSRLISATFLNSSGEHMCLTKAQEDDFFTRMQTQSKLQRTIVYYQPRSPHIIPKVMQAMHDAGIHILCKVDEHRWIVPSVVMIRTVLDLMATNTKITIYPMLAVSNMQHIAYNKYTDTKDISIPWSEMDLPDYAQGSCISKVQFAMCDFYRALIAGMVAQEDKYGLLRIACIAHRVKLQNSSLYKVLERFVYRLQDMEICDYTALSQSKRSYLKSDSARGLSIDYSCFYDVPLEKVHAQFREFLHDLSIDELSLLRDQQQELRGLVHWNVFVRALSCYDDKGQLARVLMSAIQQEFQLWSSVEEMQNDTVDGALQRVHDMMYATQNFDECALRRCLRSLYEVLYTALHNQGELEDFLCQEYQWSNEDKYCLCLVRYLDTANWASVVARSRVRASADARKPLETLIKDRAEDDACMLWNAMQQPSLHHMICEEIATRN